MKIRINGFGANPPSYLGSPPKDADSKINIVKYEPNHYYGKLQEYLDDGWEDLETRISKNNCTIDKNSFKREESKHVVATLTYCPKEEQTQLETVGHRVLNLTQDERNNFFEVYNIAARMLCERELAK